MFQKLIKESNGNYSKYIIMPTILEGAVASIKTLPTQDVYIRSNQYCTERLSIGVSIFCERHVKCLVKRKSIIEQAKGKQLVW